MENWQEEQPKHAQAAACDELPQRGNAMNRAKACPSDHKRLVLRTVDERDQSDTDKHLLFRISNRILANNTYRTKPTTSISKKSRWPFDPSAGKHANRRCGRGVRFHGVHSESASKEDRRRRSQEEGTLSCSLSKDIMDPGPCCRHSITNSKMPKSRSQNGFLTRGSQRRS